MADDAVSRSIAIMMPDYGKGYVDAMARKNVVWYWLKSKGCFEFNQGGRTIEERVRLEEGSPFGFLGGMEGHTPQQRNEYQVASFDWKGFAHAFAATYKEKRLCKEPWQIIPLLKSLAKDMTSDMHKEFGTQIHGDGTRLGSTALSGFQTSITTSAQTYGGLSQTTYTNWDCQRTDATGFAQDPLYFLQKLQLDCAVGEAGGRDRNQIDLFLGTKTDFIVCCQNEAVKQRYEQDIEMAKAGFQNFSAWGVPFVWDELATANRILGLNSKLFRMLFSGPEALDTGTQETIGFPPLTLGFAILHGQLINTNPRGGGLLYNTGS